MSDSRQDKPASIPSWQTKEQSRENEDNAQGSDHSGQGAPVDSPRAALLAKATKFLDEDEIREASTESKISFLEGKGLTNDEIQELFRISRHGNHLQAAPIKIEGAKSESDASDSSQKVAASKPTAAEPHSSQSNDIPPIITYPEFLIHPPKPPPLIAAQRLLMTAYIVSGAAALTYGASKYIVEPMVESVTSARRSLFEIAGDNLKSLNEKLEDAVSIIPKNQQPTSGSGLEDEDLDADTFFNRSAGTQTSPQRSRSSSTSSGSQGAEPLAMKNQSARLENLAGNLKDLLNPPYHITNDLELGNHTKERLDDFRRYLDGLMHDSIGAITGFSGNIPKEDSISTLKAEIRQTKGVLLSSRNFPSSVGTNGWRT